MDRRSLRYMPSTDTFVSLLQLDPAPMDPTQSEIAAVERDPSPHRYEEKPARTSQLGLGGYGRGPVFYLTRIQKYSSYAFLLFTSVHFANTSVIPLLARSVPASETYLIQAREIYQAPISEPLIVGLPILAHVASGLALRLVRRAQNLKRYYGGATPGMWALTASRVANEESSRRSSSWRIWPALSWISASGYVLSGCIVAHVAVNRVLPLVVEGDSSNIGLAFVSHGFSRHALTSWTAYACLIGAGCGHMVWGMARWKGLAPPTSGWTGSESISVERSVRRRRRRAWFTINGVVIVTAAAWAAGGLGIVAVGGPAPGWVGTLYDGLYKRVSM